VDLQVGDISRFSPNETAWIRGKRSLAEGNETIKGGRQSTKRKQTTGKWGVPLGGPGGGWEGEKAKEPTLKTKLTRGKKECDFTEKNARGKQGRDQVKRII